LASIGRPSPAIQWQLITMNLSGHDRQKDAAEAERVGASRRPPSA
jgi:hypothetical protein